MVFRASAFCLAGRAGLGDISSGEKLITKVCSAMPIVPSTADKASSFLSANWPNPESTRCKGKHCQPQPVHPARLRVRTQKPGFAPEYLHRSFAAVNNCGEGPTPQNGHQSWRKAQGQGWQGDQFSKIVVNPRPIEGVAKLSPARERVDSRHCRLHSRHSREGGNPQ